VSSGHHKVEISRPDKQLFPGITKADLVHYYENVAPTMLPHVAGRPLNLERYPDGIEGSRIMQQHASKYFPDWIARVEVPKAGGTVEHVMAQDADTLAYLANQACITFHGWLSRTDRLDRPDRMIVDLDPSENSPDEVRAAAGTFVALLRELGLRPWAMATGSRGYHVVVPLARRADYDVVREFSRDLAELAVRRQSDVFTVEQRKAKRGGRILVDVMRNAYAHTAVSPYAVRPRPGAPVATPLHLEELDDDATRPDRWTLNTVLDRLADNGDPWQGIFEDAQTLTSARRRLNDALAET
jgi:bifunctional non-homologous end joining protein LigD